MGVHFPIYRLYREVDKKKFHRGYYPLTTTKRILLMGMNSKKVSRDMSGQSKEEGDQEVYWSKLQEIKVYTRRKWSGSLPERKVPVRPGCLIRCLCDQVTCVWGEEG